ncbi:MAG TPA: TolC family protein [Polyangiaceae bacterium]|nr:TolC family protein [Polyangiaceae bacterium]
MIDTGVSDAQKAQAIQELKDRLHMAGPGQGLTSDEAARRAMQTNATIEAKRKALEEAESGIDSANAAYWPTLKLSASYTRLSHVPSVNFFPTTFVDVINAVAAQNGLPPVSFKPIKFQENAGSFDASLQVPISDYVFKVSHGVAGASKQRDAAAYDRNATVASVARDARVAYYTWVRQQTQVVIANQALEQAQGHQRDTQNSFAAGLASKADVLRTQSDVANAMLQLETARNNTAIAATQLDVAMGLPPGQQHEIGEEVFVEAPELAQLPTSEAGLREALAQRAEVKSLDAASAASREQAKSARIGNYPRLDGQAAASYANPNQRYFIPDEKFHGSWQAGVVLSWTPTAIPMNNATAATADVKAEELLAQRRAVEDGIKVELEQAARSAETARYSIGVATTQLMSAEESYRVRTELFRAGRGTNVELTDAETTLTNARIQLADAYITARIALVQLNHALGRDATPPAGTDQSSQ